MTVHGNMAVGVIGDDLIVRVGPEHFDDALTRAGVQPFDFTGRPMTGWILVQIVWASSVNACATRR